MEDTKITDSLQSLDGYSDIQAGMREKTKIKEIKRGKATLFYSGRYWDAIKPKTNEAMEDFANRLNYMKEQDAIELVTENGATTIISLPQSKLVHPKSKLGSFKRIYGSFPKVGLEVLTEVNQQGFNQIVI
jgi:hypothetical protein